MYRPSARLPATSPAHESEGHVTRVFFHIRRLDGHRQIYCREFCDYFLSRGFSVTVATCMAGLDKSSRLAAIREHPQVRFVSDPQVDETKASAQLQALGAAVRQAAADVTFLAEADDAHGLLSAQIARPAHRLPGRRIGLFIRSTNYVHGRQSPQVGRFGRVVAEAYMYRPLSPAQPRIFHEIVTRRFSLLDTALCLDEVFVASQGRRHIWLPDIALASAEGEGASAEAAAWQAEVSTFVKAQSGKPVVVYTGAADPRRGYQALLQFASDIGGCFIHCGRPWNRDGVDWNEKHGAKARLVSRCAILESGRPYKSFETASVTLRAARCVVLPYPRHLGSSGAMLQSLMAGRPVLVPDQGLMAWRVRNFGLGLTYAPGNWRDMRYKFFLLQTTPSEVFAEPIRRFLAYFGRVQFEAAMDYALGLTRTPPRAPTAEGDDPFSQTTRNGHSAR
jgi:hypothetical protein